MNFPPSSDDVYEEGGRIGEGRQEEKAAGMHARKTGRQGGEAGCANPLRCHRPGRPL